MHHDIVSVEIAENLRIPLSAFDRVTEHFTTDGKMFTSPSLRSTRAI